MNSESFIIHLINENVIVQNKADKDKVRRIYYKYKLVQDRTLFWPFLMQLWDRWYVDRFNKTHIFFNPTWTQYFRNKELRRKNALVPSVKTENKFVNQQGCTLCAIKFVHPLLYKYHQGCIVHKLRLDYVMQKRLFSATVSFGLQILMKNLECTKISTKVKTEFEATVILSNETKSLYLIEAITPLNLLITEVDMEKATKVPKQINAGERIEIILKGSFQNSCKFNYPIVIIIKDLAQNRQLYILKEIPFEIVSEYSNLKVPDISNKMQEIEKLPDLYSLSINDECKIYYPKQVEQFKGQYVEKLKLEPYKIPETFLRTLNSLTASFPHFTSRRNNNHMEFMTYANKLNISTRINEESYCSLLDTLLYIEEHQMQIDIKDFNTQSKLQKISTNIYELNVPGLAESRPSLLIGDNVYVSYVNNSKIKFLGKVSKVLLDSVHLRFHKSFDLAHINDMKYKIEYGFNRRTLKVEHQALRFVKEHNLVEYFFPKEDIHISECMEIKSLIYFNRNLNDEQKCAVQNILQPKGAPYLLFGPPGTGKTSTMIEAILQVWKNFPEVNILVCTPSNASANEISTRLLRTIKQKSDIFRLLGSSYGTRNMEVELDEISNLDANGEHFMPSMENLLKYRIMLTTIMTAARLINGVLPKNHYSYVFIDESGFATETETLVAIAGVLSSVSEPGTITGQVVLAGDPKQLGPRIHSNFAKYCGFSSSMLSRLMETCNLYARNDKNQYDTRFITKLINNYRSHKTILSVPNQLFYDNELVPIGNDLSNMFCKWEFLVRENFPVIFHNVEGDDMQDDDSPSFYNIQEVEEVMSYLQKLIGSRVSGKLITQGDIGVITPYRKQVDKLCKACRKKNWRDLAIGSVEQFQGKEKLIIIISTVRSKSNKHLEQMDNKFNIGFLRNPKRFNVALTRPKALLLVIGNLLVLKNDPNWSSFIEYCENNRSVAGKSVKYYAENETEDLEIVTENINDLDDGNDGVDFTRGIH